MAHIRKLNPAFFLNDDLGALHPLARLLFMGLWCVADHNGRLEDRPARLKAMILPYDDCDVDQLLQGLADSPGRFIQRLKTWPNDGYIKIPKFSSHQDDWPEGEDDA